MQTALFDEKEKRSSVVTVGWTLVGIYHGVGYLAHLEAGRVRQVPPPEGASSQHERHLWSHKEEAIWLLLFKTRVTVSTRQLSLGGWKHIASGQNPSASKTKKAASKAPGGNISRARIQDSNGAGLDGSTKSISISIARPTIHPRKYPWMQNNIHIHIHLVSMDYPYPCDILSPSNIKWLKFVADPR